MKSDKILVGVKSFMEFIGVSEHLVYKLFRKGMPGGFVDGRIYGHVDNVEEYFKAITRQNVKDITEEDPEN